MSLGSAPPAGSTASAPYLGSVISATTTSGTVVNSTATNVNSISLPPGIWLVFGNITYNNFAGNYSAASISATSAAQDSSCITTIRFSGTATSNINVTRGVIVSGSNQTFYLVGQVDSAVATNSAYFYAVRIA